MSITLTECIRGTKVVVSPLGFHNGAFGRSYRHRVGYIYGKPRPVKSSPGFHLPAECSLWAVSVKWSGLKTPRRINLSYLEAAP